MLRTKQDYMVKVEATFRTQKEKLPLSGKGITIKLWDQDLFVDDFIAPTTNIIDGKVEFTFPLLEKIRSFDSPFEVKPDLYMVIEKNGEEVYRTHVTKNVDFHIGEDADQSCFKQKINLGLYEIPDSVLA